MGPRIYCFKYTITLIIAACIFSLSSKQNAFNCLAQNSWPLIRSNTIPNILFTTLFLGCCFYSFAQPFQLSFQTLDTENGLSQGTNAYIYQDSRGFIWVSSLEGLNRFDGKSVKVYKSVPGNPNGMRDNLVTSSCFEDASGNLWFTTYQGLNCYLRDRDEVIGFQLERADGSLLMEDYAAFHLEEEKLWLRIGDEQNAEIYTCDISTGQPSLPC